SNTIDSNHEDGIFLSNRVFSLGSISQSVQLSGDTLTNNGDRGLQSESYGDGGGAGVTQGVTAANALNTNNENDGIQIHGQFSSGASFIENVLIDPSTMADNGDDGIEIHNDLSDGGSFAVQIAVLNNTIVNNDSNGFQLYTHASNATITQ